MASIPLPALSVQPPQNALEEFARVAQIGSQIQNQKAQALEIQQREQQNTDLQATTEAMRNWDPKTQSYDDLMKDVLARGGSANAATTIQQHGIQVQKGIQELTDAQRKSFKENNEFLGNDLEQYADPKLVPDEEIHDTARNHVMSLVQSGRLGKDEGMQLINGINNAPDAASLRQGIDHYAKLKLGAAAVAAQEKTAAETSKDTAQAREATATAALKEIEAQGLKGLTPDFVSKQVDNVYDPKTEGTPNQLVKAQALGALERGDVQGAKDILNKAFQSKLEEQKAIDLETNPKLQQAKVHLAKMTKQAEEAITDGDPKAAGELLVNGDVSPSQLVSARKPAFAQQAFTAARDLAKSKGVEWTAQKAEADFQVAKSPANLAFFGSAKSLTDKGGTLDQLKAAAKDIPEHDFPVFNSVDDWIKASTGSGPIAKYAALALGVADDYSKVMGGGQGSDTSRVQALNLIAAKESPDQKQKSLEGIRGAVNSQKKSRIGNNHLLNSMYGNEGEVPANDFFTQHGGSPR